MDCFHNLSFSLCRICQKTLIEAGFAEAEEIKEMEKKIRNDVQKEVMKAKESLPPKVLRLCLSTFMPKIQKMYRNTLHLLGCLITKNRFMRCNMRPKNNLRM